MENSAGLQKVGSILNKNKQSIASDIVSSLLVLDEHDKLAKYDLNSENLMQFALYDISKLFTAIIAGRPPVFAKYMSWQRSMMESREVPIVLIKMNLAVIKQVVKDYLPNNLKYIIDQFYEAADEAISIHIPTIDSFIDKSNRYGKLAEKYLAFALIHQKEAAEKVIFDAFESGIHIKNIYSDILQPAQYEVGRLWQINRISVAKEHYVTETTKNIMTILMSKIDDIESNGNFMIAASLGGELHEMGIRFVADHFRIAGWQVLFFGSNTPKSSIIKEIEKMNPHIVAISATTSSQIYTTKKLIQDIRELNVHTNIIVGGYVFNQEHGLDEYVEADGYAPDAESAVLVANELMNEKSEE